MHTCLAQREKGREREKEKEIERHTCATKKKILKSLHTVQYAQNLRATNHKTYTVVDATVVATFYYIKRLISRPNIAVATFQTQL